MWKTKSFCEEMFSDRTIRAKISFLFLTIFFLLKANLQTFQHIGGSIELRQMQHSSPPKFKSYTQRQTNYPTSRQIGMVPPRSSFFESSYSRDHQPPIPFHDGATQFDSSRYFYRWQIPHVEYITDIQPNDGT